MSFFVFFEKICFLGEGTMSVPSSSSTTCSKDGIFLTCHSILSQGPKSKVQLTPSLPEKENLDGVLVVIQPSVFNAWWLRILDPSTKTQSSSTAPPAAAAGNKTMLTFLDLELLKKKITELEAMQAGAVYVAVPEVVLATAVGAALLQYLIGSRYQFHHQVPKHLARPSLTSTSTSSSSSSSPSQELCWYKWCRGNGTHDLVPSYATAIEGAGLLFLSPNESQVLLVFERATRRHWGRVGGAVDHGEGMLTAALREAKEEVGIEHDPSFTPRLAMYYHQACSRDGFVNDNFCLFVVKAKSLEVTPDQVELAEVKWFDIAQCLDALEKALGGLLSSSSSQQTCAETALPGTIEVTTNTNPPSTHRVGTMELLGLRKHALGKTLPMMLVDSGRNHPSAYF